MLLMDWNSQIEAEFIKARQARARGNEGQARVCARRAAGFAAREYFIRHGRSIRTPSAYDLLNLLVEDPSLPDELHRSAEYLILRVNEEFKLPVDVDLISEAKKLCSGLLKEDK
jgi:HEPN domain-containing protein